MTHRIDNEAAPGSLLKRPGMYDSAREKKETDRQQDPGHLAAIRKCPCVACGETERIQAAHVRQASAAHGKRSTGMAIKPDDMWTLPLCEECHGKQHKLGETTFWDRIQVSPFLVCERLYAASPNVEVMTRIVELARNLKPGRAV